MKWHTPQFGERRERTIFALFPICCDDGLTRWLCRVRIVEVYQPDYGHYPPLPCWCLVEAQGGEGKS